MTAGVSLIPGYPALIERRYSCSIAVFQHPVMEGSDCRQVQTAKMREVKLMGGVFGHVRWGYRVGLFAMALVLLVAAIPGLAQLPTGTILGTVMDASGALVPGAAVTAQNVETGTSRSALANETGAYRLAALPVGRYALRVGLAGCQATTQCRLVLRLGD